MMVDYFSFSRTIFELLSLLCQAWFYFRQANQHMEMDQEQLNWYQFRKAKITRILSIHRKQFKSVNYFCVWKKKTAHWIRDNTFFCWFSSFFFFWRMKSFDNRNQVTTKIPTIIFCVLFLGKIILFCLIFSFF